MNEIEKAARQPIAVDMVEMADKIAATMEELAEYATWKLRAVSRRIDDTVPGESAKVLQEWPDLFAAMRSKMERIDASASEIKRRLDAVEV